MKFVVVYSNQARAALPHFVSDTVKYHEHEEADTLIPLHVLDSIAECTTRDIHVWSPDTDVLLLLMDIASRHHLGAMTKLTFVTGKGAKHRCIDVLGRVSALGQAKSQGLLGFHNFTGADWGGKFVGISKNTWTNAYLKLSDDDPIIMTFNQLGSTLNLKELLVDGDKYPDIVSALEIFVCSVYNTGGVELAVVRWDLFRARSLEGEKLPPTRDTLIPHIVRADYMSRRDKSYTSPVPNLPQPDRSGWEVQRVGNKDLLMPILCLRPPAPSAVLGLIKCNYKKCCSRRCSCAKNNLVCTEMCKCFGKQCSNSSERYRVCEDEDADD